MSGRLEAIYIKRARRGRMDRVDSASLTAGRRLAGNANQGGLRQVTLLSAERWQEMMQEIGGDLDPSARRANLLLSGIDLTQSRDRVLRIGSCRLRIRGETRPCERMDEALMGLRHVMSRAWYGGAFGEIIDDGQIAVGDEVEWSRGSSAAK